MAVTWKKLAYDEDLHTQNEDTALGAQSENLNMNTHKIVGVVDPIANQEVATKKYVDDNIGGGGNVFGPATHSANYVPQWNGTPNSKTLIEGFAITAAGKAFLDDATAAAQRTTLGLGSAATRAAEDSMTDGSNLPDGHAVKTYGDANWSSGTVNTYGTPIDNDFAKFTDADTIEGRSYSETRSDLGLVIGTNVQAYDADLTALGGLAKTNSNFIVGNGSTWVTESGSTARTSLGLGSAATRAAEDSMTDGSNLPDGHAVKTYGDANWSSGTSHFVTPGAGTLSTAAAAAADGDVLWLKEGVYTETVPITITSKSLSIIGAGPEISIIRCTGTNGIVVDTNLKTRTVTLENFTIKTTSTGTYIAIQLEGVSDANSKKQFYVRNIDIGPHIPANDTWRTGIKLIYGWNTVIDGCQFNGKDFDVSTMVSGIELTSNSIDVSITNCHLYSMQDGITADSSTEGLMVSNSVFVYVRRGIYGSGGMLWLGVFNSHFNALWNGINVSVINQSKIVGNLIYKRSNSSDNFVGIHLSTSGSDNTITSNSIRGAGVGGTENGIILESGLTRNIVSGNTVDEQNTGIWLKSGANYNIVDSNITSNCPTGIANDGTGNSVTDNLAL